MKVCFLETGTVYLKVDGHEASLYNTESWLICGRIIEAVLNMASVTAWVKAYDVVIWDKFL